MTIMMSKKEIRRQLDWDIKWLRKATQEHEETPGSAKARIINILEDWFKHLKDLDAITGDEIQ